MTAARSPDARFRAAKARERGNVVADLQLRCSCCARTLIQGAHLVSQDGRALEASRLDRGSEFASDTNGVNLRGAREWVPAAHARQLRVFAYRVLRLNLHSGNSGSQVHFNATHAFCRRQRVLHVRRAAVAHHARHLQVDLPRLVVLLGSRGGAQSGRSRAARNAPPLCAALANRQRAPRGGEGARAVQRARHGAPSAPRARHRPRNNRRAREETRHGSAVHAASGRRQDWRAWWAAHAQQNRTRTRG
jgi:hypothetical protein